MVHTQVLSASASNGATSRPPACCPGARTGAPVIPDTCRPPKICPRGSDVLFLLLVKKHQELRGRPEQRGRLVGLEPEHTAGRPVPRERACHCRRHAGRLPSAPDHLPPPWVKPSTVHPIPSLCPHPAPLLTNFPRSLHLPGEGGCWAQGVAHHRACGLMALNATCCDTGTRAPGDRREQTAGMGASEPSRKGPGLSQVLKTKSP